MKYTAHHQVVVFSETIRRSFLKAATFRVAVIVSDSIIVYLLTGKISVALGFIVLTNLAATAINYIHERIWNRIHWGKYPKRIRVRL